jgi:hypothetical protein
MNIPSMEMGVLKRANKLYSVMSAEEKRPYAKSRLRRTRFATTKTWLM